jgi:hypothetical protein
MIDKSKYFFCYDKQLGLFLTKDKKIPFITIANHVKTGQTFSLYEYSGKLQQAINEWNNK